MSILTGGVRRTSRSWALCCCLMILMLARECTAAEQARFRCGGAIETMTWKLWDSSGREFLRVHLLQERLAGQQDVYALYDFQQYAHNLVSMARRCQRFDRLVEMSELVGIAYDALEPAGGTDAGKRWVCHGGATCLANPELRNNEVHLCSVQFLGIASAVANALASAGGYRDQRVAGFLLRTVEITSQHLLRWSTNQDLAQLRKLTRLRMEELTSDNPNAYFKDISLWKIAIYAELAGILQQYGQHADGRGPALDRAVLLRMQHHLAGLLNLFSARTTFRYAPDTPGGRLPEHRMADIDRGFWRFFEGYRYAGYERPEKPLECLPEAKGQSGNAAKPVVSPESVGPRADTGWDFSHARRLVHALEALERNRNAISSIFRIAETSLPDRNLESAFANTLVAVIWNGDSRMPLFANYWSGANGWYGAISDPRTGVCNEGLPPHGLTESFLTGGYARWSAHAPVIGRLAATLFDLTADAEGANPAFINRYYPSFSADAGNVRADLARLMFYPSLVGSSIQDE